MNDVPMPQDARKPKILLVYANTGGGHLSAARAIEAGIRERYPDAYEVKIVNMPAATRSAQVCMLYDSYNLMLKADPRYAKQGMRLLNSVNVERMIIPWVPRAFRNLRVMLEQERPDVVVSVHGILNHALIRAMREVGAFGRVPYLIVCTDLTDNFLKGWANPEATELITFTELARQQMLRFGVPEQKVRVINGFPVSPAFFRNCPSRAACRQELGLPQDAFTVLVMMGGMAVPGKTTAAVRALQASGVPLQVMVVCGMNRSLKRKMHFLARAMPMLHMRVHGFTQRVPQMMGAADVMLAKPGPGTIMEAVIKGTPLLLDAVTEPMPQEKGNLRFATQTGIALQYTSYRQLTTITRDIAAGQIDLELLRDNMRRVKNEEAIFELAEAILAHVPPPGHRR